MQAQNFPDHAGRGAYRVTRPSRATSAQMTKMTTKMPSIPLPMIPRQAKTSGIFILAPPFSSLDCHMPFYSIPSTSEIRSPPAMTEAICPLTLAPAACMRRKL